MSSLHDKVVVLTGASSGLGRAAALQFSRKGARVVLAARRRPALEETADACRRAGSRALVVQTDVTDEAAVQRLAQAALTLNGRVDVWINNAGITAFGSLEEVPFEVHRRVIETNVFGSMYGARAALPIFKRQRAGVLVNVGSILSQVGQPYVPAYVISKFAVRGLSEALRSSVADEPNIHVCSLLPFAIDTPHFEEGANYAGFGPHAMPPMQSPEKVAAALVQLVERPRRERRVPRIAGLGLALHALFPEAVEKAVLHLVREWHFDFVPRSPSPGSVFSPPQTGAHVHGRRPARIGLPGMLAWAAVHFLRLLADGGANQRRPSLRPHSTP
jgi:NAD(P)-dependent dehydrogenase (short-subunit alcohol dehydrogenase family)